MPLTTPQLHVMCNQRGSKNWGKKKNSQQIVESFSHRALFLLTVFVQLKLKTKTLSCLVNVQQIWNEFLCNQVSQMFLLLMTPSSPLQLVFLFWSPLVLHFAWALFWRISSYVRNVNTFTHAKYFSWHINSKSHLIVNVAQLIWILISLSQYINYTTYYNIL